MNHLSTPRFIVVEGPIGIGKTTLARKLAERFQAELLLEQAEENPFLEKFYQDPEAGALPAQLSFLFNRLKQLNKASQSDLFTPVMIADFLFEKDRLFAEIALNSDEFELYQQVYNNLSKQKVQPDLVIYLQAPLDVLIKRIKQRGRPEEQNINPDYLKRISDAYTDFFYHYEQAPVLIVNSSGLDLVDNQQHLDELVEQMKQVNTGKNYFNPVSL